MKIVINKETDNNFFKYDSIFNKNSNNVLITCHRRENIGKPLENICDAIIELSKIYKNYNFIFPVHPNPLVRKTVNKKLINHNNIIICEPFNYQDLIISISKSKIILSDSGGIQEESPSLGKPVLILRETTERIEGIESGNSILVGTSKDKIIKKASMLLNDNDYYRKLSNLNNPYGDGKTSEKILKIIKKELK